MHVYVCMYVYACVSVSMCDICMFMCVKYTECVYEVNVGCLPSPTVSLFSEAGLLTDSARMTGQ